MNKHMFSCEWFAERPGLDLNRNVTDPADILLTEFYVAVNEHKLFAACKALQPGKL
jgi:hypothetical protein